MRNKGARLLGAAHAAVLATTCAGASPTAGGAKLTRASVCSLVREKRISGASITIFAELAVHEIDCGTRGDRLSDPVSKNTVFEAASLSKPVFAYAVLKLVRDRRLDLDAPLIRYLPTGAVHWADPFARTGRPGAFDREFLSKVTARQLLQHTSGLPNWSSEASPTLARPTGQWRYSGEGFVLLQQVVERITGEPLDRWVERMVFRPLGMRRSSFRWQRRFLGTEATGHDERGIPLPPDHYRYPLASTTLYTTPRDYRAFVRAAFSEMGAQNFLTPTPAPVNSPQALSWALGVGVENAPNHLAVLHGGSNPGYRAYLWFAPAARRGVLFFTNSERGYELVAPLVKLALPWPHPALTAPELHLSQER